MLADSLFVVVVVLLSTIPYIQGLGFYSDDWPVLANLTMASDQSVDGLFRAVYINEKLQRPVEALLWALRYRFLGTHPLGYHLVSATALALNAALLYTVLRELGQARLLSLAAATAYGFLPHYSTDRFWASPLIGSVSIGLYLLSLQAELRAARASSARFWGWKGLGLVGLLGSTLAYEIAVPLFLVNPVLVWYRGRRDRALLPARGTLRRRLPVLLAATWLPLLPVIVLKTRATGRLGVQSGVVEHLAGIASRAVDLNVGPFEAGLNLKRAVEISYGDYGLGLPGVLWRIVRQYPNGTALLVSAAVGLIIYRYLRRAGARPGALPRDHTSITWLVASGLVVFGLGYAIFLTNRNLHLTASGVGNRAAVAAALGVALSLIGLLGWLSAVFPSESWRRTVFCGSVAALCAGGSLVNSTLGSFWVAAYREQQEVLADIQQRFPSLPAGSTLILDGVCPYVGPAIVFESSWDLRGALQVRQYRAGGLRADVVTPSLQITPRGLSTTLYGAKYEYPFENLLIYDYRRKTVAEPTDAEAAAGYFKVSNPDRSSGCPPGHEGHGVEVF